MASSLVYTSARPSAATIMRDIAARTAAQRRTERGMAAHDPEYGMWVCKCPCRRCIPSKSDCGGCIYDGCDLVFLSHEDAARFYAIYHVRYNPRTRKFE